jgi:mono/diheme cytochrome c family protein
MSTIGKLAIAGVFFAAATMTALYLMFSGPRMKEQPKLVPYRMALAPLPDGVVPLVDYYTPVPSAADAVGLANPIDPNATNLERGRVYYGYYCGFCHGTKGDGEGPVGQSYMPAPPDLRSQKVGRMTDGELCRAMLAGTGHEPVLEYTVDADKRWYIVMYVRHLHDTERGTGQ